MIAGTAHVRVSHVTKRFGAMAAVDDVSFEVPKGSFATLLGPSGCGKTTTLRMIAGFYDPDEGDIEIAGRRVNNLPVHRRGTAMVFQDYALFPHMSVRDNVAYGLKVAHVSGAELSAIRALVSVDGEADRIGLQGNGARLDRAALEAHGLAKREVDELLAKLAPAPARPDFELDVSKARSAEHFAERFAAAVPKGEKPTE